MSEWVEYITFNGVSPMADLRKENGHEEPWTIDYFGVGNENWGCGGNMRPESIMRMNTADTRLMSEIMQAISQSIKSAVVQMWMTMSGQRRLWLHALTIVIRNSMV